MINDKLPGFSFVIPVLNGERFIEGCLKSIIAEMTAEDEITVVDNGSTDRTREIVRSFAQVRLLEHPHVTISTLRNWGAAISTREYLAFIDADILVCPGWREAALTCLQSPEVDATGSVYDLPASPTWVEITWFSSNRKQVKSASYLPGGNLVVHRAVFEDVGGFNEELITDEDCELGLHLRKKGYRLLEDPAIRVIHLGNAKTLKQFYRKMKWHATSALKTFSQSFDKPMLMTFLFMLSILWLIAAIPLSVINMIHPGLILLPLLAVLFVTALYRVMQRKNYHLLFHMIVIYFAYYLARSTVIIKTLLDLNRHEKYDTDESRGK